MVAAAPGLAAGAKSPMSTAEVVFLPLQAHLPPSPDATPADSGPGSSDAENGSPPRGPSRQRLACWAQSLSIAVGQLLWGVAVPFEVPSAPLAHLIRSSASLIPKAAGRRGPPVRANWASGGRRWAVDLRRSGSPARLVQPRPSQERPSEDVWAVNFRPVERFPCLGVLLIRQQNATAVIGAAEQPVWKISWGFGAVPIMKRGAGGGSGARRTRHRVNNNVPP